jgi:ring-1,2-phenylacetyl-CoA epoxidase subunit PaaE
MTETSVERRPRLQWHELKVSEVTHLCEDAAAVRFEIPTSLQDAYAFRPGQSLTVRRTVEGAEQRRSYSICAPAGEAPRIGVREVAGGVISPWLVREVRPGDRVEVSTPSGEFCPGPSSAGHHVLVAAGSGITPILSIAASVLAAGASITLLYGNRRTSTVMFADEVADLKDRYPTRLELVHVLSREPRDVELGNGRLDRSKLEAIADLLIDVPAVDHWWLCGPLQMVLGAQELLTSLGVPPERVHRELFYVAEEGPPPVARHEDPALRGPTSTVTVRLDGRDTTQTLPVDRPILDGAQAVRPDLPFACRGGVCGTCRARVVEGEVVMRRNFALEPSEVEAGFVLTCQATPVSDRVTVDYDA